MVVGFKLGSRMLSWKYLIKFSQLHSDLSKLNGNFPTSNLSSKKNSKFSKYKVRCFPMVIWSEFRMGQYRDDDHREDALQFTFNDMAVLVPIFIVCICLQFACNLLAICFQFACNLLAISLQFVCNLLAICLRSTCNLLAICLKFACNFLAAAAAM